MINLHKKIFKIFSRKLYSKNKEEKLDSKNLENLDIKNIKSSTFYKNLELRTKKNIF